MSFVLAGAAFRGPGVAGQTSAVAGQTSAVEVWPATAEVWPATAEVRSRGRYSFEGLKGLGSRVPGQRFGI